MTKMPKSKKELMTSIEKEWTLLLDVAENLTDEQMIRPDAGGWSPKDNLAHLTEWMNILMGYHMDKRPAHKVLKVTEEAVKGWDMEIINPILFERNKGLSRKEVMSRLKRTYKKMYNKLDALTFKELMKPRHAEDPRKRPLLLWVLGDSSSHFKEHRLTIKRGLGKKKS